ncbi:MAG TPA: dihydrodipicolinate synthase family protein [Candidatus Hydrogenedentes bacterium]|nr:dihydrodipicolinate synthase family protein [Candidatus Hydrogenedentota bacterium]HNT89282.1 dihydrodipicolinate synthase family protein [Candidatus Hydrogenedentota bacterium]
MKFKTEGIISAMVTPFTKGGEYVDFDRVGPLAAWLVKRGASGLFPCGTTGEGLLMSPEERKTVAEEVVRAVAKKAQVIIQTGAMDTATTIELTRHARDIGAHAAGVVAPAFYGYDDAALELFYRSIAKAVPGFPVLLYNIPGCAKNYLKPDLIARLAEVDNIVGVKDSTCDMIQLTQLLSAVPKDFNVINGVDDYGYQAFLAGAKAAVSGTSNAVIDLYMGVYTNLKKGNLKQAWAWQVRQSEACRIFEYGRMSAMIKEGMRLRGFDAGYARPPQRELTAAEKKALAKRMEKAGLI